MDNGFTVNAALIAAFAAIVAPTITALIHSIKEYKIKKLETSYFEKVKAIKEFTSTYNGFYSYTDYSFQATGFQKVTLDLAVLCKHTDTKNSLSILAELVVAETKFTNEIKTQYNKCIKMLFDEL